MPGNLRSSACQTCKALRTRCDQRWPACTQCRRKKIKCSGPTSLIKFVHVGGTRQFASVSDTCSKPTTTEPDLVPTRQIPAAHHYKWRPIGQVSSHIIHPCKLPTTSADQVAARLISLLDSGPVGGTPLKYLEDIPSRLSKNRSLRDTANLLCSVWGDYRAGKPIKGLLGEPAYGRALRSLQHTLHSDQALTAETLASVYLLGRTEFFFSTGSEPKSGIHADAVANIVRLLGFPKANDKLHAHIICDTYDTTVAYCMKSGIDVFINTPQWLDMLETTYGGYIEDKALKRAIDEHLYLPYRTYSQSPRIVDAFRSLYDKNIPHPTKEWLLTDSVDRNFLRSGDSWDRDNIEFRTKCFKLGHMAENPNPNSIVGTSYDFSSSYLGQMVVTSFATQVYNLYWLYDCSPLQGSQKELLHSRIRTLCEEIWKCIPLLQSLEACHSHIWLQLLCLTFEAADPVEAAYLLEVFVELDSFQRQLPRERQLLRKTAIATASALTGTSIIEDVGCPFPQM